MNCRNCGVPVSLQQSHCPNCGMLVQNINNLNINNMQNIVSIPNVANVPVVPSTNGTVPNVPTVLSNPSMSNMTTANVQQMTEIGFGGNTLDNRQFNSIVNVIEPSNVNLVNDSRGNVENQQGTYNIDPSVMASSLVNPPNLPDTLMEQHMKVNMNQVQSVDEHEQNSMYYGNLELPDESKKKRFPWFLMAIILVVIMIGGVFILPLFNKVNLTTYDGDQYTFQYNANWRMDDEKDVMTLYYSDKNSRFMFNALSTFKALNSSVETDASKKDLYNQFYNAWSDVDSGTLTGGTETFLSLNAETLYARVDYALTEGNNVGSFYVIVSEKNDKVISFMTFCTTENKEKIDKEVIEMLETLTYKKESESSIYNKFKIGKTKEFLSIGYMAYDVPECWTYDETRSKSVKYKSNIFKFIDGTTLLDIKGITPYDYALGAYGTSYESMKATITKSYGAIKSEKTKTFNGKVWYIISTPDYDASGMSYHNEIYFTMSATNKHLYYIEVYVSNETSDKKTKYLNDSIEYIINSASLYKVDQ